MFKEFFTLELRYQFSQWMAYIFFFLLFLFTSFAFTDAISIFGDFGRVDANAPFMIVIFTIVFFFLYIVMMAAFANNAALRDYRYQYHEILFSTPIRRAQYFFGRFAGAYLVSLISFTGAYAGLVVGSWMPWTNQEKLGAWDVSAFVESYFWIVVPNTFLIAAIVFALAIRFKSTIVSFLGAILLFMLNTTAGSWLSDLDSVRTAALVDPFGMRAYGLATRYWTVAERNTIAIPMDETLLLNRGIWFGVGVVILLVSFATFGWTSRKKRTKVVAPAEKPTLAWYHPPVALPTVRIRTDVRAQWYQYREQTKIELLGIIKSVPFIILLSTAFIFLLWELYGLTEGADESVYYPATYLVVEAISDSLFGVLLAVIVVVYSGELVWRERDTKMDGFYSSYQFPTAMMLLTKFTALTGMVLAILAMGAFAGIIAQLAHGYTQIDFSLYLTELFLLEFPSYLSLGIMAMFFHVVINQKYLSYFLFIVVVLGIELIFKELLDVHHNLLIWSSIPDYTYSDMSGYGPFASGLFWFNIYWLLFSVLLLIVALLLWVRGNETSLKARLKIAQQRFTPTVRRATLGVVTVWLLVGGFIFYNTNILNDYINPEEWKARQAEYEQRYKRYEGIPQPRITAIAYNVDLEPYNRNLYARATMTLTNKTDQPIDSLHLSYYTEGVKLQSVELPNATVVMDDDRLGYRIYRLSPALSPGDSLPMTFTSVYESRGFQNEVSFQQLSSNGTFFNTFHFMPTLGYNTNYELSDRDNRQDFDLPERARMASINDTVAYQNNYVASDADWIKTETTISTALDQIAVAPGNLKKEWEEDGKRYFHYQLDSSVLHFGAFISARYEVLRDRWNDVDVEIYYHPEHAYNVERMAEAVKASLAYYTEHFSPYPHQYARIVEYPRYANSAQAFPGTMPYSESIGFIQNLEADDVKDPVLQIVAHEMAHQWWAHQVVGANVQGATMLSESMAQYASMMVMKHERSQASTDDYRRYETDKYLSARGSEEIAETPLWLVENMPYIHYKKGLSVMFALQDYIGEDKVNQALHDYAQEVAYQEPPYTTSRDLLAHFRAVTPDSLQPFVTDLFENITLYNNRIKEATYEPLDNGQYRIAITVATQKFYADSLGAEKEVPINDWIDVAMHFDNTVNLDRKKMEHPEETLYYTADTIPTKVSVDPNNLLIDRVKRDNTMKVTKLGEEAVAGF